MNPDNNMPPAVHTRGIDESLKEPDLLRWKIIRRIVCTAVGLS
ncbi:MAG: hypothetical protein VCF25_23575 [Candidatus Poribacteria bacterium]